MVKKRQGAKDKSAVVQEKKLEVDRKNDDHLTATLMSEAQVAERIVHDIGRSGKFRAYMSAPTDCTVFNS